MSHTAAIILTVILILASASGLRAGEADQPAAPQSSKPPAEVPDPKAANPRARAVPAQAAPGGGVRVFIDPATGRIVQPTEAQQRELTAADPAAPKPRPLAEQFLAPNGAVGVKLTSDFHSYAVATLTPEGEVSVTCITGDLNADRAVIGPLATSQPAAKGKVSSDEKK